VEPAGDRLLDPDAKRAAAVAAELDMDASAAALPYEGDLEKTPMLVIVAFFAALVLLILLGGTVVGSVLLPSGGCGGG
jgi:hypothetical protein